jgi:hypothetical protein
VNKEPNGADVEVNAFGVKANVRNVKSLNTMITFATFSAVLVLAYGGWIHTTDAKDDYKNIAKELRESNKQVADTLKETSREQSAVTKELVRGLKMQNCLIVRIRPDLTPQQRVDEQEFCKRITQ